VPMFEGLPPVSESAVGLPAGGSGGPFSGVLYTVVTTLAMRPLAAAATGVGGGGSGGRHRDGILPHVFPAALAIR